MSAYNPTYNPASYLTDVYGDRYWKSPMPHSIQAPPRISMSLVTGSLTPTSRSMLPPSAREYLQAGATLPRSPPMATIPICTPEDIPQHPLTPPTFPPPTIMHTQSPLQLQPLWGLWIIIPPLVCRSPLKLLLLPGSKGSKATPNNATKSSASSTSPTEFARCTHTLLTNLGYPNTSATLEVWADRLLDFHKRYLQGNLPETMQGTLSIDDNLQNELCTLVEEIHTSLNPHPFEDPLDPACSFHVQCEEPIRTQSEALPSVPRQQEEINMASSILRNLNPAGGLFDQPAAHTLALSAHPWANSIPSAFQIWDQPAIPKPCSQWPPPCVNNDNWTLSYIDEPGNPADEHAPYNGPP
ncbi:hypothetical protein C0989_001006 [Termitomyces sp. Mn162]|nr:hypothetical protein C0989_001006 [Termitomyces sp. Mn162]